MSIFYPEDLPKFGTVMMDPNWPENGGGKIKRGADRHYETASIPKIRATMQEWMDCGLLQFAETCHLYMWVTNNYLMDGLKLATETLGFRYIHLITWAKPKDGIGQYRRGRTEHCIFAVRGKAKIPPSQADGEKKRSTLLGRELVPVTTHSTKPEEIFKDAEYSSPGPRIEFYSREPREGWWAFGTFDGPGTEPFLSRCSGDEIVEYRKD